jgi:RNA polymerase sigma-70 factor (ECF subfamily)
MDEPTSLSLMDRLQGPESNAAWQRFETIYRPLLDRWLRGQGLPAHDADDVRQEVLAVVLRELPHFKHNGRVGAFRAWLRGILANRLKDLWRKQKRQPHGLADRQADLADLLEDPDSALSRQWDEEHNRHVVEHLLAEVAEHFQPQTMEAFRRVVLLARKPAEVAQELGMSPNAVRIAQSRVLARLRELGAGLID